MARPAAQGDRRSLALLHGVQNCPGRASSEACLQETLRWKSSGACLHQRHPPDAPPRRHIPVHVPSSQCPWLQWVLKIPGDSQVKHAALSLHWLKKWGGVTGCGTAGTQDGRRMHTWGSLLQNGLVGRPQLGEVADGPVWQVVTDDELPALGLLPHEAQLLVYDCDLVRQQRPDVALVRCLQGLGLSLYIPADGDMLVSLLEEENVQQKQYRAAQLVKGVCSGVPGLYQQWSKP